jgi:hypothetical protein
MIDAITKKPITVIAPDPEWPYLIVPETQLKAVCALLDSGRISYDVDEEVLSVDEGPEVGFIDIRCGTDPALIQRLLDRVP